MCHYQQKTVTAAVIAIYRQASNIRRRQAILQLHLSDQQLTTKVRPVSEV